MHRSAGTAARSIDRTEFPTSPAAPSLAPASSPAVTLLECLGEARSRWLQLQAAGIYGHYQRFDWLEAWHVHVGSALGVRPLIIAGEDASGPAMILPLALNRRGGATVLDWMGWQQGNQNAGLWRADAYAAADPVELSRLLLRTARQAGASLVDLRNIPLTWEGRPHPLAHQGTPAKDAVFRGAVAEPFATLRTRLQSKDSRKKDARKQKALEALPGFAIRTLETAAEIEAGLDTLISQRQERARQTGIPSGFSAPGQRAFLRKLLLEGMGKSFPALQIKVLEAEGEVLAAYLLGVSGKTCYAYANSIGTGSHAQFSPGIVLLSNLIGACCENPAIRTLDLGLGDERYKHPWTQPEPLSDLVLAADMRGRLIRLVLDVRRTVLRRLRQTPALWTGVRAVRRFAAALRRLKG
jgi:CelD/BcsL family acetyltransferase involved in cellulose biosynthesis